jgi:dTDP-4-amino-4,6-dideoxygalactose transaminase
LPTKESRDTLQAALKAQGIPSMVYYPTPMHLQTAFKTDSTQYLPLDTSAKLCDNVLSLPMHPYLTDEDILKVTEAIII